MASLIDEALADEPAFREKTARLLERSLFTQAPKIVRAGRSPAWLAFSLKRSVASSLDGAARASSRIPSHESDAEALRHLEALDAARWARGQLGR